jgi:phospholipid/cholesterol/gamma-HCH transport system substrate-binding protein
MMLKEKTNANLPYILALNRMPYFSTRILLWMLQHWPNLQDMFQASAAELLQHLEKLSNALANNNANIDKTLKDLPRLVNNFEVTAKRFTRMADSLYTAGNQVTVTMKSGKRSIDQISQQTLPNLSDLIQKMDRIALNMEAISSDMRRNPSVIIRGSTPIKPGPGE